MALTPASILADYSSGIGTQGATLKVNTSDKRVGIGTTNPQGTLQVGTGITMGSGIITATAANFTGDLTVGGELTYEDVTNVDSVGIITARSGIEVGSGVTITTTNVNLVDNGKIQLGDDNDLQIYHDGTDGRIENSIGDIKLKNTGSYFFFDEDGGETLASFINDGAVNLFYNNSKKFETTTTGAKVTGALEVTQEYPSIRPTLDLNFAATKTLDRRITFTRDGVGTFTDELGIVKYASNNVPRFDHNPTTGESLGLLIEESRTNLVSYSEYTGTTVQTSGTVNNWALNFSGGGSASLTPGIDAPDGSNNAVRFTNNNTGFSILRLIINEFTPNGSDTYTLSFWARPVSGTGGMSCDLADGAPSGTWTDQLVANKWVRVVKSGVPSNASKTFIDLISNIDNNRVVDFWGVQLEAGAFATSYIPTNGNTVTRGADNAKITGTNFTDFHNATEGTLYGEYKATLVDNAFYLVMLSDGTDNNRTIINSDYSGYQGVVKYSDGTNQAVLDGGTPTLGGNNKTALTFKKDDFALSLNGGTVATDTSGNVSVNNMMSIGSRRGIDGFVNSTIKNIKYYNKRLPNAQLQGLTA